MNAAWTRKPSALDRTAGPAAVGLGVAVGVALRSAPGLATRSPTLQATVVAAAAVAVGWAAAASP